MIVTYLTARALDANDTDPKGECQKDSPPRKSIHQALLNEMNPDESLQFPGVSHDFVANGQFGCGKFAVACRWARAIALAPILHCDRGLAIALYRLAIIQSSQARRHDW